MTDILPILVVIVVGVAIVWNILRLGITRSWPACFVLGGGIGACIIAGYPPAQTLPLWMIGGYVAIVVLVIRLCPWHKVPRRRRRRGITRLRPSFHTDH